MMMKPNSIHPAPLEEEEDEQPFRFGRHMAAGLSLAILLLAGIGGWAATAELTGAVIASGSVAVDQKLKSVQHRDGGIVRAIAVREGDFVEEGQVLLSLEDAQTKAELSIVRSQMIDLGARRARLLAERDGLSRIDFPQGLMAEGPEADIAMAGETRLFEGNLEHRRSQKQQLDLGIAQIDDEMAGLEAQRVSKSDEITLISAEHEKVQRLVRKQLVEHGRLYTVGRDQARLAGERGEITAAIARAGTRKNEIRIQIIAVDEQARTEAQRELGLVVTRLSELQDRRAAIEDRLSRTELRASISGVVNELKVYTVGGVVSPAEVLVTIVPDNARLTIEARISPASIDQVAAGHAARLRFSTFNQRTTPELAGTVAQISPATSRDPATGETYYLARIDVTPQELDKLGAARLLPGMPVEVFISTERRTALSYFVKPLADQFARAFRER